ncbi:MAG: molecular chaperone HtpG [Spirochaetales bacterium]|nr:molecular chaperone HtpG [Spirochaetales bacterium]
MGKHKFKTEVSQLLDLIIHSLYSHKEIFLRELISNSSDALDKLKYLTLTDDAFKKFDFKPRIDISFDKQAKTLTVVDTGIGMDDKDLITNLGTIANSGTKSFLHNIKDASKIDTNLIGQFGVGFYSIFMVAEKVEVQSKKAGQDKAFKWLSDGKGGFVIEETERKPIGTSVTLFLTEEGLQYANRWEIENIVKKYSNHIPFPIYLHYQEEKEKDKKENKVDQINSASALWKRPKAELKEKDYFEFYKTISHDTEDPLHYIHTQAEGALQYTTLFFIPGRAPFDLFYSDYKPGVKLYVKRVFITDDEKELLPPYLRFVKGVIDSDDLPLNVSREMLQQNRVLVNIKSASVKKILSELSKLTLDKTKYIKFYEEFKKPLKEGLYQDFTNRETLLDLVRFKSTKQEGYTSLSEYKLRMKPDQKSIYYITGGNEQNLKNSPLLEMYKEKDIEVLIMDDEIDEIVIPSINKYKEIDLKAVNRENAAEDLKTEKDKTAEKQAEPLIKRIKKILDKDVKDVKASSRLSDSPSCVVADENDPTIQMQHIMKAMGQKELPELKPILEINPTHDIVKKMAALEDENLFKDISRLLLEQALLVEGVPLKNPSEFIKRLNKIMNMAL